MILRLQNGVDCNDEATMQNSVHFNHCLLLVNVFVLLRLQPVNSTLGSHQLTQQMLVT